MNPKSLFLALLCTVACAGTRHTAPTTLSNEALPLPVMAHDEVAVDDGPPGITGWVPAIFSNLWDILSMDLGSDYGAGVHVQATNLARIGIGEYADFGLLGIESDVFKCRWHCPLKVERSDHTHEYDSAVWDVGVHFGVGIGGYVMVHTAEIVDWVSVVIGFGYWSLKGDF